ncbi:MAG: hypothetical protein JF587_14320 [Catenulisporales bacterium]|jgi:hypothetical protein|nr:hypothetical protein [Catenulisporales bacterium]
MNREPRPFGVVYIGLLILAAAGTAVVFLLLKAVSPHADQLEVVKTSLAVVAGSGAGAGLYVSYRRQRTSERDSARSGEASGYQRRCGK